MSYKYLFHFLALKSEINAKLGINVIFYAKLQEPSPVFFPPTFQARQPRPIDSPTIGHLMASSGGQGPVPTACLALWKGALHQISEGAASYARIWG